MTTRVWGRLPRWAWYAALPVAVWLALGLAPVLVSGVFMSALGCLRWASAAAAVLVAIFQGVRLVLAAYLVAVVVGQRASALSACLLATSASVLLVRFSATQAAGAAASACQAVPTIKDSGTPFVGHVAC
jgi:hypothetical protein